MGFLDDIDTILAETPATKRTHLFSATMPPEIEKIARKYMHDAVEVSSGKRNEGASDVRHIYYLINNKDRFQALQRIADLNPRIYGIIFCRTRQETKEVAEKMISHGYNADALHGDLAQSQRDHVMHRFRSGNLQMLVATDVAARGLDVNDLTHIINYNLPDDNEVYLHRSGRTGRAGKSGVSISIVTPREQKRIRDIEKLIGKKFKAELLPSGKDICQKQLFSLIDIVEKVEVNEEQIADFLPAIYKKLDWLSREDLIKHFVSVEFNRFLELYIDAPDLNEVMSGSEREKRRKDNHEKGEFVRLKVNVGRNNDLNPARLIGLINDTAKSRDISIGKIDIMRDFSLIEVEKKYAILLLNNFKGATFDGIDLIVHEDKKSDTGDAKYRDNRREKDGGKYAYENKRREGYDRKPAYGEKKRYKEGGSQSSEGYKRKPDTDRPHRDDDRRFQKRSFGTGKPDTGNRKWKTAPDSASPKKELFPEIKKWQQEMEKPLYEAKKKKFREGKPATERKPREAKPKTKSRKRM